MKKDILIKLRVIFLISLPILFLLSTVLTVLYLCGITENQDVPYLAFSASIALNSVYIIINQYVKKEDMDKIFPKEYMVFFMITTAAWLISYLLFVFLK